MQQSKKIIHFHPGGTPSLVRARQEADPYQIQWNCGCGWAGLAQICPLRGRKWYRPPPRVLENGGGASSHGNAGKLAFVPHSSHLESPRIIEGLPRWGRNCTSGTLGDVSF